LSLYDEAGRAQEYAEIWIDFNVLRLSIMRDAIEALTQIKPPLMSVLGQMLPMRSAHPSLQVRNGLTADVAGNLTN